MKAQTHQKRNLLWIAFLITAYTTLASAHPKFQQTVSMKAEATHQASAQ